MRSLPCASLDLRSAQNVKSQSETGISGFLVLCMPLLELMCSRARDVRLRVTSRRERFSFSLIHVNSQPIFCALVIHRKGIPFEAASLRGRARPRVPAAKNSIPRNLRNATPTASEGGLTLCEALACGRGRVLRSVASVIDRSNAALASPSGRQSFFLKSDCNVACG